MKTLLYQSLWYHSNPDILDIWTQLSFWNIEHAKTYCPLILCFPDLIQKGGFRKGTCLCISAPNQWAQLYFKKNKQIDPNEVLKELNRTVWVLDECLGPICFTLGSGGSWSTGLSLAAPYISVVFICSWPHSGKAGRCGKAYTAASEFLLLWCPACKSCTGQWERSHVGPQHRPGLTRNEAANSCVSW